MNSLTKTSHGKCQQLFLSQIYIKIIQFCRNVKSIKLLNPSAMADNDELISKHPVSVSPFMFGQAEEGAS